MIKILKGYEHLMQGPVRAGNDAGDRLLQDQIEDRVLYLDGAVRDDSVAFIIRALEMLSKESDDPINLIINSPGGSVQAGLALIDTMDSIAAPVYTSVRGMAASMGALILAAGDRRNATSNSVIMIHEGSSGGQGTSSNYKAGNEDYGEILDARANAVLAASTGKSIDQVKKDGLVDNWMWPEEAKEYGIIDEIIAPKGEKLSKANELFLEWETKNNKVRNLKKELNI